MKHLLVALMLAVAPTLARAETVTLTIDECMGMAHAVQQQLNSQKQEPAVSQKVQKVVEWLTRLTVKFAAEEVAPELRDTYLAGREEVISDVCLMQGMQNGGEVSIPLDE